MSGDASRPGAGRPPLPRGWRRALFRLPVRLYRLGLGGLLGQRFLCSFMGFEVREGSAEEFRRVGTSIPFVRFEPTEPTGPAGPAPARDGSGDGDGSGR